MLHEDFVKMNSKEGWMLEEVHQMGENTDGCKSEVQLSRKGIVFYITTYLQPYYRELTEIICALLCLNTEVQRTRL